MNIAVCEDNAADSAAICKYINEYCENSCFVCEINVFESGEALLAAFSSGAFDVVFLDIYMDGITGVETARRIRTVDTYCSLVFITSSPDHMRDGFSVLASSYVVKPLKREEMATAFVACRNAFLKNARYIEVKSEYQSIKIPLVRLHYVEVDGRTSLLHTAKGVVKTYMPIDEIEKELGGRPFLRCHRSFLVNMNHISKTQNFDLVMRNGAVIPMRKNGRKEIREAMSAFASERLFEVGGEL